MIVEFIGIKGQNLIIGKKYLVLGISHENNSEGEKKLMFNIIFDDDAPYSPAIFDADLFKIVSPKIPSNWVFDYNKTDGTIELSPARWQNDKLWQYSFWEDYWDDSYGSDSWNCYEAEVARMYEECGKGLVPNPFENRKPKLDTKTLVDAGKVQCPVCDNYTFIRDSFPGSYDVCEDCGWVDDFIQYEDHESTEGVNKFSLNQSRKNYNNFGKADPRFK